MVKNNILRLEAVRVTPASNTNNSNIPVKPKTVRDTSISIIKKVITVNNKLLKNSQFIKNAPKSAQLKVIV